MRFLFLDAYFEPEQVAFTHLEKDLLKGLVSDGHEINVICPTPTRGISIENIKRYKNIKSESLYNGHVKVARFSAPQERRNPVFRALRYFWCNFRMYQMAIKEKNVDIIFSNSTPPTQGWLAGKVAKRLKIPYVYSLQDIFPDSLITTGLTKRGSFVWKIGRKIENTTYLNSTKIIVISEAMKTNLLKKGVREDKIEVISNWIDPDKVYPVKREDNSLFDELGINRDKYIVLYAGNFGEAQGAEIILDAAERLKSEKDIQFVIFGGGTGYSKAENRAQSLSNVLIHPLLSQERISEVYSLGNIALITCKKGVGVSGMPSKTWSIMACNVPIIASFDRDSELNSVLEKSASGISVNPEDANELSSAIINNYVAFKNASGQFSSARDYIKNNASKKQCVKKYIEVFKSVTL